MITNSSALVVDTPSTNAAASAAADVLHDIKGPVEVPDYWMYLWIGLIILGVIAAGYFLWDRWLKERFTPKPLPPLPPHVRAKRKLREAIAQIHEPQVFTVLVSDTIRIYLEERFDF